MPTIVGIPYRCESDTTITNLSNAYSNADSTTYASIYVNGGTSVNAHYAKFFFDFQELPSYANIVNITGRFKINKPKGLSIGYTYYSGDSGKTYTRVPSGFDADVTINVSSDMLADHGGWTASELKQSAIRFNFYADTGTQILRVYGAELTVEFSTNGLLYYKTSGVWQVPVSLYKKVSGTWVEQYNSATVFDANKRLRCIAERTVTGTSPLVLPSAHGTNMIGLVQAGKCEQSGTPTPTSPLAISCNNGDLAVSNGSVIASGTAESILVNGQTATAANLFSAGNFKDTQDIISGAITRNVGVIALDGTEEWTYNSANKAIYLTNTGTLGISGLDSATAINAYCTHFAFNSGNVLADMNDLEFLFNIGSGVRNGRVSLKYVSEFTSLNAAKAWLSARYANGTPVIIVYPLANSTTESVTAQPLVLSAGTNTVTVTASVSDIELSATYFSTTE